MERVFGAILVNIPDCYVLQVHVCEAIGQHRIKLIIMTLTKDDITIKLCMTAPLFTLIY